MIAVAILTFATEAWPAVFGGLIPVIGLAGVGYLIIRAVRDDGRDEE